MDYIALAKRAYKITIENKFLWIFGLLAGSVGGISSFRFNSFGGGNEAFNDARLQQVWDRITTFYQQHTMAVLTLALVTLLIMVIAFVVSILSQGSLISSVARLNKEQKVDFWKGLKEGSKYFWRIWGLMIAYSLVILLALIVFGLPLAFVILTGNGAFIALWTIIGILVFTLIIIVISFVAPYSQCLVVINDLPVVESIRRSITFVRHHFVHVLVVYLMLMAIGFMFGLAVIFALLIVGAVLTLIGLAIGLTSVVAGLIYALACVIAIGLVLLVLSGLYNAYQTAVITLAYEQLKYKKA